MRPSVNCYPQPAKGKSLALLDAFARGAGGRVVHGNLLLPGPAAFYGTLGIESVFRAARCRNERWYYLDNAFFDAARGTHYRVGVDSLQGGEAAPDWARWQALGTPVEPWRRNGRHVLVVLQSDYYLTQLCGFRPHEWQEYALRRIKSSTDRPVVVRHWVRNKAERMKTLQADLEGCWALVTHASAAANEALLAGVPVFVTDVMCAAAPLASPLWKLESPAYPDGREEWAARLAARQWTREELAEGLAWRTLHAA